MAPPGPLRLMLAALAGAALLASAGEEPEVPGLAAQVLVLRQGRASQPLNLAVRGEAIRLEAGEESYLLLAGPGSRLMRVFPGPGLAILLPAAGDEPGVPRFLDVFLPGRLWGRFADAGRLDGAEEATLSGRAALVVASPDETWEARGLRHTYWLDEELHIPLRMEIETKGEPVPDVISLESLGATPDADHFLLPEETPVYSLDPLDPEKPSLAADAPEIPATLGDLALHRASHLLDPKGAVVGYRLLYRTEDALRWVSVVWARADRPDLVGPLRHLQGEATPGWEVAAEGWTGRAHSNLPRPSVLAWLAPRPAPEEAEEEQEEEAA